MWIDTGSPNTLVHEDFTKLIGVAPIKGKGYSGNVVGMTFKNRPAVTIPEIVIDNSLPLKNVRVITALTGDEWRRRIVIGLNVLNHLTIRLDRSTMLGKFEWLESLVSNVSDSSRTKFDHIIWNGSYLLSDEDSGDTSVSPDSSKN